MTAESYRDWLRSFEHTSEHNAAQAALHDLGRLSKRARDLLLPIVAEAILMERRTSTRSVERLLPIGRVLSGRSTIEQRKHRLAQYMALADGRTVRQGEATEEDWLLRIELLQKHRKGIEQSIDEAQAAIEAIRDHGVSCLDEIEEAA